jgi:hypothetical protein
MDEHNYDRRAATNAVFLRGRSGWELRVIGELSSEYEGVTPDPLETAALVVDNVKKKYDDLWRAMMETNLAPKAVADTLARMKDRALSGRPLAASIRTAYFNVGKVKVVVDVNLDPDKVSWTPEGKVLFVGTASFVLPNKKHKSQPYKLVVSEQGVATDCTCSDPMHEQLILLAAKENKRELSMLIEDEKQRGGLRK